MTIDDKRRQKSEEITALKQPLLNDQASSSIKRTKFTSPNPPTKGNYSRVYQDAGIAKLLMLTSKAEVKHDTRLHVGTINATHGKTNIELMFNEYTNSKPTFISQGDMKLLGVMLQQFTQGQHDIISISIEELVCYLGKKNIKKARESFTKGFNNIMNMRFKIEHGGTRIFMNLSQTFAIKNNMVYFEFNNTFKAHLLKCNTMPIHMNIFQMLCSPKNNPYGFAIAIKTYLQANFNHYKNGNKNLVFTISVKTLLETCSGSGLPTYEKVMSKSRHVKRLIIEPIEDSLNVLVDYGIISEWHYARKGGIIINDYDEILNEDNPKDNYSIAKDKDYNEWVKRNVIITMPIDYRDEIAPYSKKKVAKKPLPK